jgi:hypothetical protein
LRLFSISSTEKGIPLYFKTFFSISNPVLSLIKSENCPCALFSNIMVFLALLRDFSVE